MEYKLRLIIIGMALFCLLLAGVAQANVVKKCYIDGNDWAYQTGTYALSYDYHRLMIGAEGTPAQHWSGLRGTILDEFAIYDKILSDPCIAAHANSLPANYVATVTADAPVLWLRFEDPCSANGYPAADSSGNDQNGTYIGGPPFGDINLVTGFVGKGAEFYGTINPNGTCIDVNDFAGALELQDLTVEFWIKSTDLYGSPAYYSKFFSHNGGNTMNSYAAQVVAGTPGSTVNLIGGGSEGFDPVDPDLNDGEWHHVVFTFDSSRDPNPDPNISPYPEEVMEDAPVLYLRCEKEPLEDSSGNNYWVDAHSAVTLQTVKGSMGKCALLNGGWIAAARQQTEPSSDPCYGHQYAFGPNDLTVEMWLYYPPGTTIDTFAGLWNQNAKADITEWSPGCDRADTKCRFACNENRDGKDGYAYTAEGTWATDQNNWHHYVSIYDVCDSPARITVRWYTDNVNKKDSTYDTTVFDNYLGPEMDHILFGNIGTRFEPGNNAYRQYIDEIAVYNYALGMDRIDAHYRAWQPRDCNEIWFRELGDEWEDIDKNKDCDIDFVDYALSVPLEWTLCNDPNRPPQECPPNW